MDDFNNNGNDSGVNLFKGPEPNADETQNDGGVNLEKTPEPNTNEPQNNNGINLEKAPETNAGEPQNNDGVNLFKGPEPTVNERQGVSNAQQGMNFSGQQNFGGIPEQNQPIQPVQPQFNGQNMNNMNNMGGYNPNQNPNQNSSGLSIAALVCGIVSILGFCCCTPIGILCGIAGIVLGIISKKNNNEGAGMALAGIITGAVGVVGSIIWIIIGSAFNNDFMAELQEAMESAVHFMF